MADKPTYEELEQLEQLEQRVKEQNDHIEILVKEHAAKLKAVPEVLQREIEARKRAEEALKKRTRDLGERVKELNCLYAISDLREKQDISLEEILHGVVDIIPTAWQYPEITCARITVEDQTVTTKNFNETVWRQAADIRVHNKQIGALEVFYLEEMAQADEGLFLKEERRLINAIGERMGRIIERHLAEESLRKAYDELEQRVQERTAQLSASNEQLKYQIEHRMHAEEALRESRRRYKKLWEEAPIAYHTLDTRGIITQVNQTELNMLGYTRERNVSGPLLVVSCINIFTGLGGTSDYRDPFLLSIRNNCILQLWQRTTNNNQRTLPKREDGR